MKALVLALALCAPAAALACPYCAQREDPNNAKTWTIVGSMIALPFGIAAAAIAAVRKLNREDEPSK